MEKLKKLSINKMNEFPVIDEREQMELKGGNDYYKLAWKYVWDNEIGGAVNAFESWWAGACNYADQFARGLVEVGSNIAEEVGAHIINKLGGGNTPFGAPIIIFQNTDIYGFGSFDTRYTLPGLQ